jgi:enamine deaminase RidA (YjgF/YER057c/UK114 family)
MTTRYIMADTSSQRAKLSSDLVLIDGWGFVSGLQPIDLKDDRVPLPEMVEAQTRKILANLEVILGEARLSKDNVASVNISLVDFKRLYDRMNSAYIGFFREDRLPARNCVGVAQLTRGALVEMSFVLRVSQS